MIHPGAGDTSTVRSVFIVDPDNKLRLSLTYPKSVGRNFDEIVRVIDALQATDRDTIATPADWRPGDRVIVSPGVSTEDAKEKFQIEERFWYSADLRAKYIARVPHPKLLVLSNY